MASLCRRRRSLLGPTVFQVLGKFFVIDRQWRFVEQHPNFFQRLLLRLREIKPYDAGQYGGDDDEDLEGDGQRR